MIAFASTTRGGTISKIVPRLSGPVTTPRNEVHYVATEYSIVNLKGLSSTNRAIALIGLAPPNSQRHDMAALAQANPSKDHTEVTENCITDCLPAATISSEDP